MRINSHENWRSQCHRTCKMKGNYLKPTCISGLQMKEDVFWSLHKEGLRQNQLYKWKTSVKDEGHVGTLGCLRPLAHSKSRPWRSNAMIRFICFASQLSTGLLTPLIIFSSRLAILNCLALRNDCWIDYLSK